MLKRITIFVIIIGFIVRIWGVYPGFPSYHPDEPQIYSRALLILQDKEADLGYWGYPALFPIINAVLFGIFFIPITLFFKVIQNPLIVTDLVSFGQFFQKHIFGVSEINVLYWGRIVSALFGGASVILVYLIGKNYFNKFVGLLSALFLTFNFRHVLGSHFALPDVANGFFLLLPIFFSLKIINQSSQKNYLLAGITAGLSMSVKLSPFAIVPPIVAHFLTKKIFQRKSIIDIFLMSSIFIATLLIVNVFHLFHFKDLIHDIEKLDKRYLVGSVQLLLYPYVYLYKHGIGPAVSILALTGLFLGLFKNTKKTLILAGPVVLTFFTLTFYSIGGVYVRNFVATIPLIVLFAGFSVWQIGKKNYLLAILITLFALVNQSKDIFILNTSYSKNWNIENVKEHFKNNYLGKTVVASPWFGSYIKNPDINFVSWNYNSLFNLSELQSEKADYVLVDTDALEPMMTWWMTGRGKNTFLNPPKNLLYSTFPIASISEILKYRVKDFTKPARVPDTNFFIVKIPSPNNNFVGQKIQFEDFNSKVNWKITDSNDKIIPNTGQIFEGSCGGCIKISKISEMDTLDTMLTSSGLPRTFSITSEIIEFKELNEYRISANVWNTQGVDKDHRDGFIKIELYKTKKDVEDGNASKHIFVSERYYSTKGERKKLTKILSVPSGYSFGTISFQVDRNIGGDFYFDDLLIEKSKIKNEEIKTLDFPEDLFFIESIL